MNNKITTINSYNIYGIISILKNFKVLYSGLIYGFVIVVIELLFLGHVFGSGIVIDF